MALKPHSLQVSQCQWANAGPDHDAAGSRTISAGGVSISQVSVPANATAPFRLPRLCIAIVENEPFEVEAAIAGERAPEKRILLPNSAQILPADKPLNIRWDAPTTLLVVKLDDLLVELLAGQMGERIAALDPCYGLRDAEIDALAMKARLELHFGGASGPLVLQSIGVLLAACLLQKHATGALRSARAGGLCRERLQRVVKHVEASLSADIPLSALAEIAGLSVNHFASEFRTSAGVSPHRYILERRIARAMERLAARRESVTEIAHGLGFSSHGHFTTSFRRFAGVTPSQFRERVRRAAAAHPPES